MGNMTRLLNKHLKTFIVFTCVVFACSILAYFYLVESIWINELDDHNQHLKEQIQTHFDKQPTEELIKKITLWNDIQTSSHISPVAGSRPDSVYLAERKIADKGVIEMERFRG